MQGKIIRIISNLYTVKVDDKLYDCQARGKFRKENITPLVGDDCIIDCENKYILEIKKRKNELSRPLVANIDTAVIVTSLKEPELSLNLLDKMLSLIIINKINPIICFTKIDLITKKEHKNIIKIKKYYESIGIKVVFNNKISKLKKLIKNQVVVFTGQTGAGKSSLLNRIDKKLHLKTGEISKALGRGKHTTRHVELFEIKNTYIVDTPGFSALDLATYSKEQIRDSFIEFSNYKCDYKDCMHLKEKNCSVKNAVVNNNILESRYENYKSFIGR